MSDVELLLHMVGSHHAPTWVIAHCGGDIDKLATVHATDHKRRPTQTELPQLDHDHDLKVVTP
jgi:hypothetical protein